MVNEELIEISLTDALTRLPNRRDAPQQLKIQWKDYRQSEKPISLMMIDADHFKEVNDTYGHDAGNNVFCEVARKLQHSVRYEMKVKTGEGYWYGSICIGVATRQHHIKNYEALIKAADDGGYAAKSAGKNCVRMP